MTTVAGLSLRRVSKMYRTPHSAVHALEDCSLEIPALGFSVLVGPSGCGKTTLLNIVAGFDTLTSGEVSLGEEIIAAPGRAPRPGPDRVVVFQHGGLFPWMTVLDNVCYGPLVRKQMTKPDVIEIGRSMLSRVGLSGVERLYPGDVSSGMRRRIEIIRALIGQPQILLMDEPFRALDALTKSIMHDFLLRLYDAEPSTILFITHDLIEALFLADTVAVMTTRPGRIKTLLPINVPRPRSHKVLSAPEFLRLKDELTEAIHQEAVKAFELGERELAR
jgi:NitT/TauT family transport system ATP-binding protein